MDLKDLPSAVAGFYSRTSVEQLLLLAWHHESVQQKGIFTGELLRKSFREVGVEPPDMSVYLGRLATKKPPQIIREKSGYRLSSGVKRDYDAKFGNSPTTVAVTRTLSVLPSKVPDLSEREFLNEALICYKGRAYRAAIIMTWNLTYDHFIRWILSDPHRLTQLNSSIPVKYPKKTLQIHKVEDFDDLKESELIEIARTAKIIDKNTTQILQEKLTKRNMAAHPSRVVITQHQADDVITDLVENVVLKLV